MEEKKLGTKEMMEALEAIKILSVAGAKIGADGKINTDDLKHLVDVAKKANTIIDGFKRLDMAVEEAKYLDEEGSMKVLAKVFEIIKAFKSAKGEA